MRQRLDAAPDVQEVAGDGPSKDKIMKTIKTYRAVLPPWRLWRLNAIKWPLVSRTVGATTAVFIFQSGARRLVVTSV